MHQIIVISKKKQYNLFGFSLRLHFYFAAGIYNQINGKCSHRIYCETAAN